jgi:hypothetical protein
MEMGFARKEVYYWLETATTKQLKQMLNSLGAYNNLLSCKEQLASSKWFRTKIIEEIKAREEAGQR